MSGAEWFRYGLNVGVIIYLQQTHEIHQGIRMVYRSLFSPVVGDFVLLFLRARVSPRKRIWDWSWQRGNARWICAFECLKAQYEADFKGY